MKDTVIAWIVLSWVMSLTVVVGVLTLLVYMLGLLLAAVVFAFALPVVVGKYIWVRVASVLSPVGL